MKATLLIVVLILPLLLLACSEDKSVRDNESAKQYVKTGMTVDEVSALLRTGTKYVPFQLSTYTPGYPSFGGFGAPTLAQFELAPLDSESPHYAWVFPPTIKPARSAPTIVFFEASSNSVIAVEIVTCPNLTTMMKAQNRPTEGLGTCPQ
jgi:hypothetical protein